MSINWSDLAFYVFCSLFVSTTVALRLRLVPRWRKNGEEFPQMSWRNCLTIGFGAGFILILVFVVIGLVGHTTNHS